MADRKQMTRLLLASVTAALFATGAASAGQANPKSAVLPLQAMPTGFKLDTAGWNSIQKVAKTGDLAISQLRSWGYVTGYESDYERDVTLTDFVRGAIKITSSASLYKTTNGAAASLQSSAAACRKAPAQELSVGAKIGDEAHLCAYAKKSGGFSFEVYAVIWRRGEMKAAVVVAGIKGGVSPTEAVSLAEAQDKRLQ